MQHKPTTEAEAPIRVLVVTPMYAPDYGPSAPIYTALCEDLQQMGCDVTVVTAFPHYGTAAQQHPMRAFQMREQRNGVSIIRTYVYTVPRSALWQRLLYHLSFNVFAAIGLLSAPRPDVVIADAPALWSGLPLLVAALLPRRPFIYVVHDIYPDVLERLGLVRKRWLLTAIHRIEQFYYRCSSAVSVLSEGFRENLLRKDVPDAKLLIVPACVDTDFLAPDAVQGDLRERWGLTDRFVVLYAGNLGFSQGLENVLEAAARLQDHPEIAFVFVGEGAADDELRALATQRGLANVHFHPFQPREDVPAVYALADTSLISLKSSLVAESVPSKTYSIMSSGRPIIAAVDSDSETGRLLQDTACGLCVPPEDPEALAAAILDLSTDAPRRQAMGGAGRATAVGQYSRRVAAQRYLDRIRAVLGRGAAPTPTDQPTAR